MSGGAEAIVWVGPCAGPAFQRRVLGGYTQRTLRASRSGAAGYDYVIAPH